MPIKLHLKCIICKNKLQQSPNNQAEEQSESNNVKIPLSSEQLHLLLHLKLQSSNTGMLQ